MVDVLIITALKEEYDAAYSVGLAPAGGEVGVVRWEPRRDVGRRAPYVIGEYTGLDDVHLSVALARPVWMGGRRTAPLATTLAAQLKPACLSMSGVCAGEPTKSALGDVVVADMTFAYDEGKQRAEGFEGDYRQHSLDDEVLRTAQDLEPSTLQSFGEATDEEARLWFLGQLLFGQEPRRHDALKRYLPPTRWAEQLNALVTDGLIVRQGERSSLTDAGHAYITQAIYEHYQGPFQLPFGIVVGPMASGSAVNEDPSIWKKIREMGVRKITGLEMEAAHIATVAEQQGIPFWLVAKGVIDHANPERDDRYKEFAAKASAEVLFTLLNRLAGTITAGHRESGTPSAPGWRTRLQRQGLHIWTSELFDAGMATNDPNRTPPPLQQNENINWVLLGQGDRLPNLQRQFESLGQKFDDWVDGCRRGRGEGSLKVFWIVGEPGPVRSKALLAVISRARSAGRTVYDPGRNLDLAAEVIAELGLADLPVEPALIPVDLPTHRLDAGWIKLSEARDSVHRYESTQENPDPVLIIGGTVQQEKLADGIMQSSIEIDPFDVQGRPYPHQRTDVSTESMTSLSLTAEDIFNQGLPTTAPHLFGREKELVTLRDAWLSDETQVLSVVAFGGVGKSALVNRWLRKLRKQDYLGAQKVFAWSFYSQGTKENWVSADAFVQSALKWLGDDPPPGMVPSVAGERLAKLIREHHLLLVLDGLEPLQHPETAPDVAGNLKDSSIRSLLHELVKPGWAGLCLITTRVPLTDLTPPGRRAPSTVAELELDNLDEHAGADLLQSLIGPQPNAAEAREAVREVHCHALAVNLLGRYLRDVHGGQLSGRFELQELSVAVDDGGHARRITETYAKWLEDDERSGELAILDIIGLFDRPAPYAAMAAVLADTELGQSAPGLNEIGSVEWEQSVTKLRRMGLLSSETAGLPGTLDAHPLVREHFRDRLRTTAKDLWHAGNRALYDYYKRHAPELPSNAAEMTLLYAAVNHGCAIGQHQEVFDTVLLPRVWRGPRESYSTRILGMTGSEVVALSNYFQMPSWNRLRDDTPLSKKTQLQVISSAALRLRQLGRLDDARDSCGVFSDDELLDDELAADAAYVRYLHCELSVIAGQLSTARESAEAAIEFADRCDDPYHKMYARACLAEVDFMVGAPEQAEDLFEEAAEIATEQGADLPFLYSQNLYRYGYFIIETDGAETLLAEAEQHPGRGLAGAKSSQLSRAIQKLILGAARRQQVEQGALDPTHLTTACTDVDDAIVRFRGAGYTDYIVRGLLERAHLLRIRREPEDYARVLDDLDEALAETTHGNMKLLAADVYLQMAACHLTFWPNMTHEQQTDLRAQVADTVTQAARRVNSLGYGRRRRIVAELKRQAREYGII
ncbi:hypothetical protein ACFYOY_00260 [Streptomyces sp. NPDC007875]|uniref:phosphorylase family protein n=1 Tax=Streptomyces sp. NPDC007875 TaxID=3364783 RepID=UPI0036A7130C